MKNSWPTFYPISLILGVIIAHLFLASCSKSSYEEGDSRYSYLKSDFVEANTDSQGRLIAAKTDNDVRLAFSKPYKTIWNVTPDSVCRVLLSYNMYANGTDSTFVEPLTAKMVYTISPKKTSHTDKIYTDPVNFVSAWKSKNGKYINIYIGLKTGKTSDDAQRQSIGLMLDSTVVKNGVTTYCMKFLHSQGGVPEYYTSDTYVSIPIKEMTTGNKVRLSLNTYNGWIVREFTR